MRNNTIQFIILLVLMIASHSLSAHGSKHQDSAEQPIQYEQKDWGMAAQPQPSHRQIQVVMSDNMRFSPEVIQVKLGQTIQFNIQNKGAVLHEFACLMPGHFDAGMVGRVSVSTRKKAFK